MLSASLYRNLLSNPCNEFCRLNSGVLYSGGRITSYQRNKACGHTAVYTFCASACGFVGFMDYYIRLVIHTHTKRYRLKQLNKQAYKWTEKFHWQVTLDQQLIDAKPVCERGESNSSCLPHWSLDSHTVCSSWSALFTTDTAENDKASTILLLICFFFFPIQISCFFRCPGFTFYLLFPLIGASLSLMLYLSTWVEPWGIFFLVYSKERSDPFFSSYNTCVLPCPCFVGQSVNVSVMHWIKQMVFASALPSYSFPLSTSSQQFLNLRSNCSHQSIHLPSVHSLFFACLLWPGHTLMRCLLLRTHHPRPKLPTTC